MIVGPVNPDGSFPVPTEEEIKAAWERALKYRAPVFPKEASVVIPKGMTADDYQDMNILPGNRIGWQQKQEHLHRLSDLYTLGYLTEEEYEKRMEWVNNAQTIEQVNIVFTDLRKSVLSATAGSYLKPVSSGKDDSWWLSILVVIAAGVAFAAYLMLAWPAELLILGGVFIFGAIVSLYHRK